MTEIPGGKIRENFDKSKLPTPFLHSLTVGWVCTIFVAFFKFRSKPVYRRMYMHIQTNTYQHSEFMRESLNV